jgi:hypothetical protein
VSTPDPHHLPPFTIDNAILCEEVRAEVGSKFSLLGVIPGMVNAPTPGAMRISSYIELRPARIGIQTMQIEVAFSGKSVARAESVMDVKALDETAVIALPSFPLIVQESGDFTIDFLLDGYRERVLSRHIRIAEPPSKPSTVS